MHWDPKECFCTCCVWTGTTLCTMDEFEGFFFVYTMFVLGLVMYLLF